MYIFISGFLKMEKEDINRELLRIFYRLWQSFILTFDMLIYPMITFTSAIDWILDLAGNDLFFNL